jgi:tetratricopeptide (TPR) repeat protein
MYIANNIATPMFKETKDLLQKATTISPADPQPYWVLLQLEAASGNFEETKNLLEKAVMLQPQSIYTHKLVLQFAKNTNNKKYYLFALNRAKQAIPNFSINEIDN